MKTVFFISIVSLCFHLMFLSVLVAAEKDERLVTVSTICLQDDSSSQTSEYVVDMIKQAAERQDHDLIVVPLTPFMSFREGHEGQDLDEYTNIARTYKTYLAIALREQAKDGRLYYTSILLGRRGQIVGTYRKSHALPDDKISLGDDLPVFQTDFGVLGFSIGTDFYFPEIYEVEMMKGADVLIWQHYPERFREHYQWVSLLKARALDSHAHLMTAMYADPRCYLTNRYAGGYQGAAWGRSMILNRVGTPIADTGYEDGIATAIINLNKRKVDPYVPVYEAENIFFCNSRGDRTAFRPLAEPWNKPELPEYEKRQARIAVGYFWVGDQWNNDEVPEVMFRVMDEAAKTNPDLVLLSEMSARVDNDMTRKVAAMVAERARKMNAYVLIGGLDDVADKSDAMSHAWLWDRKGERVFKEPIYWPKGFSEINVYDTDFARIGVHLCGDLYTGEIDRVLALKGAEIIFDPSHHWGADGYNNELLLRARASDNGCWIACAHGNSSDPGLRSLIVDPYGYVMAASHFQKEGAIFVDIDFDQNKVYYAGRKPDHRKPGRSGTASYINGDIPEQHTGWRDMIFARRRPELYKIIPTVNDVILKYRQPKSAD